jgi:hypothetical protein
MEEKVIATGTFIDVRKLSKLLWEIGSAISILLFLVVSVCRRRSIINWAGDVWGDNGIAMFEESTPTGVTFLFDSMNSGAQKLLVVLLAITFVIGIFLLYSLKDGCIVITNKRVYGNALFGRRVDIPIDLISGVSSRPYNVTVSGASGQVNFWGVTNCNELHNAIGGLLLNRQNEVYQKWQSQ